MVGRPGARRRRRPVYLWRSRMSVRGKHPRVRWEEYQERRPDRTRCGGGCSGGRRRTSRVVTGAVSGLIVVDVDPRAGGDEALATLEARLRRDAGHGRVPHRGGWLHLYFRHPGEASRPDRSTASGSEVKADGRSRRAPPSVHRRALDTCGRPAPRPTSTTLADLPSWLTTGRRRTGRPRRFAADLRPAYPRRTAGVRTTLAAVRCATDVRRPLLPLPVARRPSPVAAHRRRGMPLVLLRLPARRRSRAPAPHRRPPCAGSRTFTEGGRAAALGHATRPHPCRSTWLQWPTLQPVRQSVVGEAAHADVLEQLAGGRSWTGPRTRWFTARLVREHTNPHDPGAVNVPHRWSTVGYPPRGESPPTSSTGSSRSWPARAPAQPRARTLTGGWDERTVRTRLDRVSGSSMSIRDPPPRTRRSSLGRSPSRCRHGQPSGLRRTAAWTSPPIPPSARQRWSLLPTRTSRGSRCTSATSRPGHSATPRRLRTPPAAGTARAAPRPVSRHLRGEDRPAWARSRGHARLPRYQDPT